MKSPIFEFKCIGGEGQTKSFSLKNVSSVHVSQIRVEAFDLIYLDGTIHNLFLSDIDIPTSLSPGESGAFTYNHRYFIQRNHLSKEFRLVFTVVDENSKSFRCTSTMNVDNPYNKQYMQGEWITVSDSSDSIIEGGLEDGSNGKPTVFISYNWGSDGIADEIEKRLSSIAIVLRDKKSITPWGSISDFMKRIRETDLVVVIVSDGYLKSNACLYEIVQLLKEDDWILHSMFLVEENATGIYKPQGQLKYVKYWEGERKNLEEALVKISPALVTSQAEELNKIQQIQLKINDFMKRVADCNNPDLEKAIDAIEQRVLSNCPVS